jgi:hypothetical protein
MRSTPPRGGRRQGSRRCTDAPPQVAARRARSERPNRMVGTGPCAGPSRPSASVRSQQGHGARALSGRRRLRTPRRRAATRRARRRASFSRSTIDSRRADDSCSPATPLTNSLMSALENHEVSMRTQRSCAGSPGRRRRWRPAVRRRAGVRRWARAGRRERQPCGRCGQAVGRAPATADDPARGHRRSGRRFSARQRRRESRSSEPLRA